MTHNHRHPNPPIVDSMLSGAPEQVRLFLNDFLNNLYCALCDRGGEITQLKAQITKLTKQRDELIGIATCMSDDKAIANASPETVASADATVADLIAKISGKGGAA